VSKLNRWILISLLGLACVSNTSCALAKDRVYGGRVIDADTQEPIEGVVVVAYWYERMATPAGSDTRLKEVKEALTDKDGKWSISGEEEEKNVDSYYSWETKTYYTRAPLFTVFKPGYCPWPNGFSVDPCKGRIKPGGIGGIMAGEDVVIPKLEKKEDRLRAFRINPDYGSDPNRRIELLKKQKHLLRYLNEESRILGLSENTMYKNIYEETEK
jgi:hypothetical protein